MTIKQKITDLYTLGVFSKEDKDMILKAIKLYDAIKQVKVDD